MEMLGMKRSVFAIMLVLALSSVAGAVPLTPGYELMPRTWEDNLPPRLKAALDALKKGNADKAMRDARVAVKEDPESDAAHEVLGMAAFVRKDWKEAERAFLEAARLNPKSETALANLGQVYLAVNQPGKAAEIMKKVLEISPQRSAARRVLALALLRQGQAEAAIAELKAGIKAAHGRDVESQYLLASIYHELRRSGEAERFVTEALNADPNHLPALLLKGLILVEQGKDDAGLAILKQVAGRDRKSPWVRLGMGVAYRQKGQWKEAVQLLEQVSKEQPGWAMAHFRLGEALLAQGQTGQAMKAFSKAEQASADAAVAKIDVANLLLARGRVEESIAKAKEVLNLGKFQVEAHSVLTRAYLARKEPGRAESEIKNAIAKNDQDPRLVLILAGLYQNLNQPDKEEATLKHLIHKFPQEAEGPNQLGWFYLRQRRHRNALDEFQKAVKIAPDLMPALDGMAQAFSRLGEHANALATVEGMIKRRGETAGGLVLLSTIHERAGNVKEALDSYQRALQLEKGSMALLIGYAELNARAGKRQEAIRLLNETARSFPKAPLPHWTMGQVHQAGGDNAEAIRAYREALNRDPNDALVLNNLAWLLGGEGKSLVEAVRFAEQAYKKVQTPEIADTLGWLYYLRGDLNRATPLLQWAVSAAPQNESARFHYGMLLLRQGKKTEARSEFTKVAESKEKIPEVAEARKMLQSLSSQ
jgi:tetratricopeptide (TPR) repeat protein